MEIKENGIILPDGLKRVEKDSSNTSSTYYLDTYANFISKFDERDFESYSKDEQDLINAYHIFLERIEKNQQKLYGILSKKIKKRNFIPFAVGSALVTATAIGAYAFLLGYYGGPNPAAWNSSIKSISLLASSVPSGIVAGSVYLVNKNIDKIVAKARKKLPKKVQDKIEKRQKERQVVRNASRISDRINNNKDLNNDIKSGKYKMYDFKEVTKKKKITDNNGNKVKKSIPTVISVIKPEFKFNLIKRWRVRKLLSSIGKQIASIENYKKSLLEASSPTTHTEDKAPKTFTMSTELTQEERLKNYLLESLDEKDLTEDQIKRIINDAGEYLVTMSDEKRKKIRDFQKEENLNGDTPIEKVAVLYAKKQVLLKTATEGKENPTTPTETTGR